MIHMYQYPAKDTNTLIILVIIYFVSVFIPQVEAKINNAMRSFPWWNTIWTTRCSPRWTHTAWQPKLTPPNHPTLHMIETTTCKHPPLTNSPLTLLLFTNHPRGVTLALIFPKKIVIFSKFIVKTSTAFLILKAGNLMELSTGFFTSTNFFMKYRSSWLYKTGW